MLLRALFLLLALSVAWVGVLASSSATGNRALVILPSRSGSNYSILFSHLQAKGYDLTVRTASGSDLSSPSNSTSKRQEELTLERWGDNQFDHLIHLAPSAPAANDLSPQKIVAFLQRGGNAVLAYDSSASDTWRDFAHEFHVSFDPSAQGQVRDHFRSLASDGDDDDEDQHTILVGGKGTGGVYTGGVVPNGAVFSPETVKLLEKKPVLYKGIAHNVGDLPLGFPLLRAPGTSYTVGSGGVVPSGPETTLVSAFQLADLSSRVLFLGSTTLLSDAALVASSPLTTRSGATYAETGNWAFVTDAFAWTLQERGVVRVVQTAHHRVRTSPEDVRPAYEEDAEGTEAAMYRVKDTIAYSIDLQTYHPIQGWIPAPTHLDLQLSIAMLDPYVVVPLTGSVVGTSTRYETQVQLPDQHGVFSLVVNWKRWGWTFVSTKDTAPVRPYNSNEHPRWLSAAYPYATGAVSTILAFVAFAALWLFTPYEEAAKGKLE